MITIPPLVGIVIGGAHWRHLLLLAAWWVGYFLFHAASLWLKSRRKARYWPPVKTYALITAPLLVVLLVAAPWLIGWAAYFAPLAAISAWCIANRKERSLLNDVATITAACLMTMVAFDAAHRPASLLAGVAFDPLGTLRPDGGMLTPDGGALMPDGDALAWAWRACAALTIYFLGTIPHVKSLIRERNNPRFWAGSITYHALALGGAILVAAIGTWPGTASRILLLVAAGIALARAIAMPAWQRRAGRPIRPMHIGLVEIGLSALMAIAVLTS